MMINGFLSNNVEFPAKQVKHMDILLEVDDVHWTLISSFVVVSVGSWCNMMIGSKYCVC